MLFRSRDDKGLGRRLIVIPFVSTFRHEQEFDDYENNKFIVDIEMDKKLDKYKEQFLYLLVQFLNEFINDDENPSWYKIPKIVKDTTETAFTEADPTDIWIKNNIEPNPNGILKMNAVYSKYTKDQKSKQKNRNELKSSIERCFKIQFKDRIQVKQKRYRTAIEGFSLITDEEEDEIECILEK